MPDSPGLGEQALNKAAEIGLSSQLDEVENLNVNIKTDPLKLLQGQVDTVRIEAEGLVMQKDLRLEEMDMEMTNVGINPITAALGKIELTQTAKGTGRVLLTEDDINRAFNSEYIRTRLQSQKIKINGQLRTIVPENVEFSLPGKAKVELKASVLLQETRETHQIAFSAVPHIAANGKAVYLENVDYGNTQEISPELTKALVEQTSEILNLNNFNLKGMTLRVKQLHVKQGKLILEAEAYVKQLPYES